MIAAVVFSRDRACQLDCLLRSIDSHAGGVLDPITVLWTATDGSFERTYEVCAAEHPEVTFQRETDFRADVAALIAGPELISFFTDDDVVYRPLGQPHEVLACEDMLCFSLRLGLNTPFCYPLNRTQRLPSDLVFEDDVVFWAWDGEDGDWGYPGSLDGHVFRGDDLRNALALAAVPNPNWLEDALTIACFSLRHERPCMASYEKSALVSIPANRVNETHGNRFGMRHPHTTDELNVRYAEGERIDFAAMDFGRVRGAHHELPYSFLRRAA